MRISDWSSDVCSSDLPRIAGVIDLAVEIVESARAERIAQRGAADHRAKLNNRVDAAVTIGIDRHRSRPLTTGHRQHLAGQPHRQHGIALEIGRAHVRTPVTNAHLVCRLLLEKKKRPTPKYDSALLLSTTAPRTT